MVNLPHVVYWRLVALVLAACALLIVTIVFMPAETENPFLIGAIFGTAFQLPLLAAMWAALGPNSFLIRVPLTLIWAFMTGLALYAGIFLQTQDKPTEILFLMIPPVIWLLGQIPFWLLRVSAGVRIRHQSPTAATRSLSDRQFGIRQLMILTAVTCALLGGLRWLIDSELVTAFDEEELTFSAFMVLAQIAFGLPLALACFLPRHYGWGILLALICGALVTAIEVPVLSRILGPAANISEWLFVPSMNITSTCWILIFAVIVRQSGYHFGTPPSQPPEPIAAASG